MTHNQDRGHPRVAPYQRAAAVMGGAGMEGIEVVAA